MKGGASVISWVVLAVMPRETPPAGEYRTIQYLAIYRLPIKGGGGIRPVSLGSPTPACMRGGSPCYPCRPFAAFNTD